MFAPIINQWSKIIISTVLALGITEILLVLAAKFIAAKKGWPKRTAILIAQLVWLFLAYQIAMHAFQQLGSMGQAQTQASVSDVQPTKERASSPEAAIISYITKYQEGDAAGVVLADAICSQRALRKSAAAPAQLQKEEFKQAILAETQRILENDRKKSSSGTFVGQSDDPRMYGLFPLYMILYPGMEYQILEVRHPLLPSIEVIMEVRYDDPLHAPFYKSSAQDINRKVRRMIVVVGVSEVTEAHATLYRILGYRLIDLKSAPTEYF